MPLAAKKKTMGSKAKAEDSVVAIRSVPTNVRMFDGSIATKFIAPGEAIPRGDPAVEAEPDAFMDVTNGVPRERAVVALETVRSEGPGGVRTIHKGQWTDEDDPQALGNVHLFRRPDPDPWPQ